MPNIFQLGVTAMHEWGNIEKAIQLSQPVLDTYNQHRGVVDRLVDLIDELKKVEVDLMPIVAAYQKVDDQLVPLLAHLSQAFYPHEIKDPSRAVPVPADGYNVRWLQQSLVDLAEHGKFDWPPNVSHRNFVDDDAGPKTRIVVEAYQQSVVDRGTANWSNKDVDGWAGMKTCAAIYNDLGSV